MLAGAHVDGFGERLTDNLQSGTDDREIAARPSGLLTLLNGFEIDSRIGAV